MTRAGAGGERNFAYIEHVNNVINSPPGGLVVDAAQRFGGTKPISRSRTDFMAIPVPRRSTLSRPTRDNAYHRGAYGADARQPFA